MVLYRFVNFYMKFLLELGFEVLKSVNTCWEYGILPLSMDSWFIMYGYMFRVLGS